MGLEGRGRNQVNTRFPLVSARLVRGGGGGMMVVVVSCGARGFCLAGG